MKETSIGDVRYRIVTVERDGQWIAHAEREGVAGGTGSLARPVGRGSRTEAGVHSTHSEGGLTVKDFGGAAVADQLAQGIG
jgi:hypothetical protein